MQCNAVSEGSAVQCCECNVVQCSSRGSAVQGSAVTESSAVHCGVVL